MKFKERDSTNMIAQAEKYIFRNPALYILLIEETMERLEEKGMIKKAIKLARQNGYDEKASSLVQKYTVKEDLKIQTYALKERSEYEEKKPDEINLFDFYKEGILKTLEKVTVKN